MNQSNPLTLLASAPISQVPFSQRNNKSSWFEAMAEAWGKTLDNKASEIETAADKLSDGDDTPAHITKMTALAQQMGFMSNSAHTSLQAVGQALETTARKGG